jgi:hypothetical protein
MCFSRSLSTSTFTYLILGSHLYGPVSPPLRPFHGRCAIYLLKYNLTDTIHFSQESWNFNLDLHSEPRSHVGPFFLDEKDGTKQLVCQLGSQLFHMKRLGQIVKDTKVQKLRAIHLNTAFIFTRSRDGMLTALQK